MQIIVIELHCRLVPECYVDIFSACWQWGSHFLNICSFYAYSSQFFICRRTIIVITKLVTTFFMHSICQCLFVVTNFYFLNTMEHKKKTEMKSLHQCILLTKFLVNSIMFNINGWSSNSSKFQLTFQTCLTEESTGMQALQSLITIC